MKFTRRWLRRRHYRAQHADPGDYQPGPLECCQHCKHDINDPPHERPCPQGCNGAEVEDVTLSWLGDVGAVTYWPQQHPERDNWLGDQLAAFGNWLLTADRFIRDWHDQAQDGIAEVDRWIAGQAGQLAA